MAPVKKQKPNKSPKTAKKVEEVIKPAGEAVVSGQVLFFSAHSSCLENKTC